ncbi:MAG: peptide synthetase [Lachnospiraceae bacterium]|nr:peptide synthetase [Lachnospiraceae bacterium]
MKTRKGYKTYPLTVAQKFHHYYLEHCPKKEVVNVGTSLTIEYEIEIDLLKQCIYEAYDRSEAMRARLAFDKKENQWYQYVVEKEERDIEYVDFTGKTMDEAAYIMKQWTKVPFVREDSPMNKVVMIKTPDGNQGIYLLGDHLLLDAQSLIGFLRDVIEIYCAKKFEDVEYPAPMRSYLEQLEKDLTYEAGSKAQQRDREFFYKLIEESEPIYNGIEGPGELEEARKSDPSARSVQFGVRSVDAQLDIFHLEEEPTTRLMRFCEEHHISLQCLLLMGIRTYLQKMNGNDDVSVNVAYARRATLSEKKSGGTRIHSFPFRTIIDESTSFIDGIHIIRDGQNEIFRHTNFNPVEYFAHRREVYNVGPGSVYEPMTLTYQPLTLKDRGLVNIGDIKYKTKWYPNGATTQAMYLTVMHRPDDNGLDFNFEHQIEAITRDKLEFFYYYLCKIMFKGIENPGLSIGEIIRLV